MATQRKADGASSSGSAAKKALGKGLSALISDSRASLERANAAPLAEGRLRELPLNAVVANPHQPRRVFVQEELEELADSIRALGVVQPVVVRPLQESTQGAGARFELIAGERRLRASKLAGLTHIPALVRPADEVASLEIALAENVAREDLNSIEEAQAYASLVDQFGLTHERVAKLVGRSRAAVSNVLRLLELPDDVQRMIEVGELSEGHGRALLALPDHGQRRKAASAVVSGGLSVRQTEALVKKLAEEARGAQVHPPERAEPDYGDLVDELYGVFEAPVRIRAGRRGGTIQIAFKSQAELARLAELLRSIGR